MPDHLPADDPGHKEPVYTPPPGHTSLQPAAPAGTSASLHTTRTARDLPDGVADDSPEGLKIKSDRAAEKEHEAYVGTMQPEPLSWSFTAKGSGRPPVDPVAVCQDFVTLMGKFDCVVTNHNLTVNDPNRQRRADGSVVQHVVVNDQHGREVTK